MAARCHTQLKERLPAMAKATLQMNQTGLSLKSNNKKTFIDIPSSQQQLLPMSSKVNLNDNNTEPQLLKCPNCEYLSHIVKNLTASNQNLFYQIGFKNIALQKREQMIDALSKQCASINQQLLRLQASNSHQQQQQQLQLPQKSQQSSQQLQTGYQSQQQQQQDTLSSTDTFKQSLGISDRFNPVLNSQNISQNKNNNINNSLGLSTFKNNHYFSIPNKGFHSRTPSIHNNSSNFRIKTQSTHSALIPGISPGITIPNSEINNNNKGRVITLHNMADSNTRQKLHPSQSSSLLQQNQSQSAIRLVFSQDNNEESSPSSSSPKYTPQAQEDEDESPTVTFKDKLFIQTQSQSDQTTLIQDPPTFSACLSVPPESSQKVNKYNKIVNNIMIKSQQSNIQRNSISRSPTRHISNSPRRRQPIKKPDEGVNKDIYKSLSQLKALKVHNDRALLESQVSSIEDFAENIVREQYQTRYQIAAEIRTLLRDYMKVLDQSIVLKIGINAISQVSRCFKIKDAISVMAREVGNIIQCENVVVYLKDQYDQVFWTIDKENTNKVIKVDGRSGVLMHTLNSEQFLRIDDAQSDPRCNKTTDYQILKLFSKNPKTLLCIPLRDNTKIIRGVLQLINYTENDTDTSTNEVLRLLTENSGQQIVSVIEFEQITLNNHRILKLLEKSMLLYDTFNQADLLLLAKKLLTEVFASPQAVIYIVNDQGELQDEQGQTTAFNTGLLGQALSQQQIIETTNPQNSQTANFRIDIDTVLPIVSVPVFATYKDDNNQQNQVIAGLQIIQDALIRSNGLPKEYIFFFENLQFFAKTLAYNLQRVQQQARD